MLNRDHHSSSMSISALPASPSSSLRKQVYGVALLLCLACAGYLYYRMQTVSNEFELMSSISSVESALKSAPIEWSSPSADHIASDADAESTEITPESEGTPTDHNSEKEKLVVREKDEAAREGKEEGATPAAPVESEESAEAPDTPAGEIPPPAAPAEPVEDSEEGEGEQENTLRTPYTSELLLSEAEHQRDPPILAPRISDKFFAPLRLKPISNPKSVRVFLVGDSLTQGAGYPNDRPHFNHAYQIAFEEMWRKVYPNVPLSVVNSAVSGECVLSACVHQSIRDRVEQHLRGDPEGFDVVVMLGGTNDLSRHRGEEVKLTEEIFHCHQRILEGTKLADGSVKIPRTVMMTLPEIHDNFGTDRDGPRLTLNGQLRTWCSGKPVEKMEQITPPEVGTCLIVDLAELLPRARLAPETFPKLWCDAVHPSERGYDFMGEIIFRHVEHYFKFDS